MTDFLKNWIERNQYNPQNPACWQKHLWAMISIFPIFGFCYATLLVLMNILSPQAMLTWLQDTDFLIRPIYEYVPSVETITNQLEEKELSNQILIVEHSFGVGVLLLVTNTGWMSLCKTVGYKINHPQMPKIQAGYISPLKYFKIGIAICAVYALDLLLFSRINFSSHSLSARRFDVSIFPIYEPLGLLVLSAYISIILVFSCKHFKSGD